MNWPTVPLRDLGQWYGGGTPSKHNAAFWDNGDVPWLSPKDMGPAVLADTQDHVTRTAIEASSTKLVPSGAVAVVVRSGILERTLPVALVPFETTLNQDMKALVARPGVEPLWVAWGLRAFERDLLRDTRKAGTTVASIEMPRFFDFELPLPPVDEQRRIVDILEEHITSLDAALRALKTALQRCEAMLAAAREQLWSQAAGEWLAVGELGRVVTGSTPSSREVSAFGGSLPFATPGDVGCGSEIKKTARNLSSEPSRSTRYVEANSVLAVCIGATLGKVGWVASRAAFNQQINAIQLDPLYLSAEYLAAAMAAPSFTRQMIEESSSTTMPILNKSRFSRLEVRIPSLVQQTESVQHLRGLNDGAQRLGVVLRSAETRGGTLRRGLLAAAFSGQLTGRASDSNLVADLADQEAS